MKNGDLGRGFVGSRAAWVLFGSILYLSEKCFIYPRLDLQRGGRTHWASFTPLNVWCAPNKRYDSGLVCGEDQYLVILASASGDEAGAPSCLWGKQYQLISKM